MTRRFAYFFAAMFTVLCVNVAGTQAQDTGTITGIITTENGKPATGINVVVEGTSIGSAADADGRFTIAQVPVGRQMLIVSGIGYAEMKHPVEVEAGETTRVALTISPSVLRLEEITVVGRQNAFESSYQVSKSVAVVESRTASTFNSVNSYDALRLIPGMNYMWQGGGRYSAPARIRGGSAWTVPQAIGDFPTIRQSGIGAEDGGLTAGLGAVIPAVALNSLTVKKGNSGVLYSGGANGGVIINQLERGFEGPPTGTLWFEINPISERLYMADIKGGAGGFDYYVATKLLNGDYQDMTDVHGRSMNSDNFFSGLARIGYQPRDKMRLEVIALNGRDQIQYTQPRPDNEDTPDIDESKTLPPNRFETTNTTTFAGVMLEHSLSDNVSYETGYSFFRTYALRYSVTNQIALRDRPQSSHTIFGNLYLNRSLTEYLEYHGKAGVEILWHRQQENARSSRKAHRFADRSIFYANSLSYRDHFFLNGGLRYLNAVDDFRHHNLWVYDLGAALRIPGVDTKLRTSYSTGYSRNKGFMFFFGPIEEAGGVKISRSHSLEVGLDQPFNALGGDGTLSVTAFRRADRMVPVFSGWGAGAVYYENRDVEGLEIMAEYSLDAVSLLGSFTYMDTEILSTTHPDGLRVGSTSVPVPRYTAGLGVQLRPTERFRLSLLGSYDDGMRRRQVDIVTGEATIVTHSAYTRINLSAGYELTDQLTARLRIENLLDEKDLGYSTETFGPGGYTVSTSTADRPGRFAALAFIFTY